MVCFFAVLLAVLCGMRLSHAEEKGTEIIYIGSTFRAPLSSPDEKGIIDQLVKNAFKQIGREARIVHLPAERSLINANRGINDGDLLRVEGIDKLYPNLVRVPVPLIDFEFVAFTKQSIPALSGWKSLEPYSVGIIRGWKILETNLAEIAFLTKVENAEILFLLLESDHADIVIYDRIQGYGVIRKLKLSNIQVMEPPIITKPMFLYLHKKHRALIPEIEKALIQLIQDGSHELIKAAALPTDQNGKP